MCWNASNQENQGGNHGGGDNAIGGKSKDASYVVMTEAIGNRDGNQQGHNNSEQEPARTDGERFRQGTVDASSSDHRCECGPAGFSDNWITHRVEAKLRASSLIQAMSRGQVRRPWPVLIGHF